MVSICSQLQNEGLYGLNLLNYNRKTWVKSLYLIYLLMSRWNPGKNIVSKCPFAYRKMQLNWSSLSDETSKSELSTLTQNVS